MIQLQQQENLAIGSLEEIKKLEKASSSNILVISDSHGSPQLLKSIFYSVGQECDALCFCGDGMPDLISVLEESHYDPQLMEHIPPVIFFVRGNGDNSSISFVTSERNLLQVPGETSFLLAGKKIFMTHGHNYNVYYGTRELVQNASRGDYDITFYGHTHIANAQTKKINGKNSIIMNPGSCSLPRGGMPHTFAVVSIHPEKIQYKYYEIKWDNDGNIVFKDFNAPTTEVKLIW